jgi:hypothetical protein
MCWTALQASWDPTDCRAIGVLCAPVLLLLVLFTLLLASWHSEVEKVGIPPAASSCWQPDGCCMKESSASAALICWLLPRELLSSMDVHSDRNMPCRVGSTGAGCSLWFAQC